MKFFPIGTYLKRNKTTGVVDTEAGYTQHQVSRISTKDTEYEFVQLLEQNYEDEFDYTKDYITTQTLGENSDGVYYEVEVVDASDETITSRKENKWKEIRYERDTLLEESDKESKILFSDYWNNQTDEYRTSWLDYRQALRDITEDYDNPFEVNWPTKPE